MRNGGKGGKGGRWERDSDKKVRMKPYFRIPVDMPKPDGEVDDAPGGVPEREGESSVHVGLPELFLQHQVSPHQALSLQSPAHLFVSDGLSLLCFALPLLHLLHAQGKSDVTVALIADTRQN